MKATVTCGNQRFEVWDNTKSKKWHVRVTHKNSGKIYNFNCSSYCETGEVIWNQANNHDIGREVNHKMCAKFKRSY